MHPSNCSLGTHPLVSLARQGWCAPQAAKRGSTCNRVPDELRRHSLSDGVGGQYSTNLDRNRYGADDQVPRSFLPAACRLK